MLFYYLNDIFSLQHLANRNAMQHRTNNKYGENLFMTSCYKNGSEAVQCWYNEIKDYRFGAQGFAMNTGHFTQVVWKKSRKLGVGCAMR